MRIWSLHPKYLDAKGLVALWREGLLAKNVLEGNTKGYKHHPQLIRFKQATDPIGAINQYLSFVYEEARSRGYNFNVEKINQDYPAVKLQLTRGQLDYETKHLLQKLKIRDIEKHKQLKQIKDPVPHPLFILVPGDVESWEII